MQRRSSLQSTTISLKAAVKIILETIPLIYEGYFVGEIAQSNINGKFFYHRFAKSVKIEFTNHKKYVIIYS